jgi:uncharacterized protein (TIGR02453 family)
MKDILNFLSELERNNNREWFDKNRETYKETRNMFLGFTEMLINEISVFDNEIPIHNPKDCMFRIFRDVRFSKDKRPYKTNYGSFISRGGRKSGYAGYYFHIQPGESFIGGGVYMPPAPQLKAIRAEIYNNPMEYMEIRDSELFKSTFPDEYADKLKTAPKGYPKDWEYIDLIRNRSYAFGHTISDKSLFSKDMFGNMIDSFKILHVMNRFLNRAIDNNLK